MILALFLMFASSTFAVTVASSEYDVASMSTFPNVFVYPNQVQVQIHNYGINSVWCNGTITIYRQSGRTQNEFYSQRIMAGMRDFRYYHNYDSSDRFVRAHHSIFCH